MGLEEIWAGADRAEDAARTRLAADRARADADAERERSFADTRAEWLSATRRRLAGGGVPSVLIEEPPPDPGPPPPPTGVAAVIGWWRGAQPFRPADWFRGHEAPPEPAARGRMEGWRLYACQTATPGHPDGQPCLPVASPIAHTSAYGEITSTTYARPVLFLGVSGDAVVAVECYTTPGPPGTTLRLGAVDASLGELALADRDVGILTITEMFAISGLHLPPQEWFERTGHNLAAAGAPWEAEWRADQLVHWELGVRHRLAEHRRGDPPFVR